MPPRTPGCRQCGPCPWTPRTPNNQNRLATDNHLEQLKIVDAGQPTIPTPARAYSVLVRELCEFIAKRGSLDRLFTPSAIAFEGLAGQNTVVPQRGQDNWTDREFGRR